VIGIRARPWPALPGHGRSRWTASVSWP